jgi:hypothetical protein
MLIPSFQPRTPSSDAPWNYEQLSRAIPASAQGETEFLDTPSEYNDALYKERGVLLKG